jgi:excisionase family DNA binding protein
VNLEQARRSQVAALTITETAQLLQVDVRTVSRACEEGQLPHLRIGRRLLIPRLPLLALLGADRDPTHGTTPAAQGDPAVGPAHLLATVTGATVAAQPEARSVINR